jgi:hypothetical protein
MLRKSLLILLVGLVIVLTAPLLLWLADCGIPSLGNLLWYGGVLLYLCGLLITVCGAVLLIVSAVQSLIGRRNSQN